MSINIIHIDDEQDVATYLDELCQEIDQDVFIHWFETFDDGIEALKEKPFFYNGLILDAKCLVNEADGVLDEKNVIKAIFEIERVFRSFQNWLPYCILSGFKEKLEREIDLFDIRAFDKNSDELSAIDYILKQQLKVNRHNIDKMYPGIIDMAEEGLLLPHNISTIIQLYSAIKLNTEDSSIIKGQLSQMRPILERMVIKLNDFGRFDDARMIPENAVYHINGDDKARYLTECFKYMSGIEIRSIVDGNETISRSKIMPSYISWQCTSLYQVASEIANHSNIHTGSKYTLEAMFNSLIDILYWYKEFITEYKNNHTDG